MYQSRHHRKGLSQRLSRQPEERHFRLRRFLWQPRELNWWIGTLFACGSLLFVLGGTLSLAPTLVASWSLDSDFANRVFFGGSIPFTAAAYLQLYQSANAPEFPLTQQTQPATIRYFGWRPHNIGWLSSALQFVGTLLFNINTLDALLPGVDWLQQDLTIWAPDMAGSALFLASGYLAFVECCQSRWAWQPHQLAWRITFINLLGCLAFMLAAVLAFVPSTAPATTAVTLSTLFTVLGAAAFFIGSLLLMTEANQG